MLPRDLVDPIVQRVHRGGGGDFSFSLDHGDLTYSESEMGDFFVGEVWGLTLGILSTFKRTRPFLPKDSFDFGGEESSRQISPHQFSDMSQ